MRDIAYQPAVLASPVGGPPSQEPTYSSTVTGPDGTLRKKPSTVKETQDAGLSAKLIEDENKSNSLSFYNQGKHDSRAAGLS